MINLPDYKKIHCIGIGGIGLSAIAEILMERGYEVSGSDMRESETTEKLIEKGANIFLGHRAKNVDDVDLVIYSAAISSDNPELVRAAERKIPAITRAQALGIIMDGYDNSVAISGTHGKTTTTSMVSLILNNAGKDPTILVGGNLPEIGGNVRIGGNKYFVTEACEYMDSFLNLKPNIEIILNIDSDHLDYFKDVDHIARSFDKFTKLIPEDGVVIAYDANPFVKRIIDGIPNAVTFGLNESCDYFATDIDFDSEGMPSFIVHHGGGALGKVSLSIPGEHNIFNALAAFACCHILGVEVDDIIATLKDYTGIKRRFEVLGKTSNNIKIVDDYAHHPAEIKATLAAVKNMRHNNLWCLFQPHTYTRLMALMDDFATSFGEADRIVLAEIYAAREKNVYKMSSKILVNKIKEYDADKDVYFFKDFDEIANFVYNNAEEGDLIITMGAGDINKVGEMILQKDRKF